MQNSPLNQLKTDQQDMHLHTAVQRIQTMTILRWIQLRYVAFESSVSPLSCPRIRLYMLRRPNTLRKYHDAELTLWADGVCELDSWLIVQSTHYGSFYRRFAVQTPILLSPTDRRQMTIIHWTVFIHNQTIRVQHIFNLRLIFYPSIFLQYLVDIQ